MVEQLHLVVERGHVDQQHSDCGSETEHHVGAIFLTDRPGAFQLVELRFEKRACHVLRCLSIHVGKCKRRRSVRATQSCESVEKWINNPPKPAMWISTCAVCGICRGCAETVLCSRACVCGGGKTVCACCVHCVCRGCSETVYVRAYAAGFPKLSARALPCMCEIRVRVLCALRVRARCVYAVCARRAGCRSSVVRAS